MPDLTLRRTVKAVQHDTLDAIAYRFFGEQSERYLPAMIDTNADTCPFAIIEQGKTIILPDLEPTAVNPVIKMWD